MSAARGRIDATEDPPAAGASDPSMLSPDDQISPDGMKLRSGKKKRRRSRETSGLTPPEEAEKKRRKLLSKEESDHLAAQNGNEQQHGGSYDDEEDSSTDDEDDQEMYDGRESLDDDGNGELKIPAVSSPAATMNGSSSVAVAPSAATEPSRPDVSRTMDEQAAAPQRLQPMPNLRIPSEQTPGRPVVTERITTRPGARVEPSRVLHFDAPASASLHLPPVLRQQLQASQQSPVSAPNQMQSATLRSTAPGVSSAAATTPPFARRVGSRVLVPQPQEEVVAVEEEPKFFFSWVYEVLSWCSMWLSHTGAWLVVMLVVQVTFHSYWMHPIMSSVTKASKSDTYRSLFAASPKNASVHSLTAATNLSNATFANISEVVVSASGEVTDATNLQIVSKPKRVKRNRTKAKTIPKQEKPLITKPKPKLPPKKVKVVKYIPAEPNANVERLGLLTKELGAVLAESDIKAISLEIAIAAARERINQRKSELLAWSSALSTAQLTLEHLAERESLLEPQFVAHGRQGLDNVQLSAEATLDTTVINATALLLWNVTLQNCPEVNVSELLNALVSTDELETSIARLRESADAAISAAVQDPNIVAKVREWLQGRIAQEMKLNETAVEFLDKLAAEHGVGLSLKSIQAGIQSRLEIERADHNGHVDYASIANGAVVVRDGLRPTSRSFVHSLPLWNRVMHYSGLRFYGHGPEAALTPTFPPDALGQCWAMENGAKDNCPDPFCGSLGTLTLRFSKPVLVSGLIVEHPPQRASEVSSAVRAFRVTGHDNIRAWPLGSFTYDINGGTSQQFKVAPLYPPIHEITLAIDSNWGSPYTCLYRFRVHGEARDV